MTPSFHKAIHDTAFELMWKLHDPIFGGSIMFNAFGLLNRDPSDIDVFTCERPDIIKMQSDGWIFLGIPEKVPYVWDIFGNPLTRYAFTKREVPVCVFVIPEEQHKWAHRYSAFLKLQIKCQLPIFGIEAKRQYFEEYGILKHGEDLVEIHHRLHGLPYP